jgi:periplasmic protein TonB
MFSELSTGNRTRWELSRLASVALHLATLLVLVRCAAPVSVMPSEVELGTPGSLGSVVYLAPTGAEKSSPPHEKPKLALNPAPPKAPAARDPLKSIREKDDRASRHAQFDQTAQGGSPYGARIPGAPLTGHEVVPALPKVFPDPQVSRADLPPGVQGDVVVEVTIDADGNVVELKLIRGIGYGIEDKVLATLRQWRFRPASKDGVTIASQHIVTFHYPA